MRPHELAHLIAEEQRRTLVGPCLELNCTIEELEIRLDRLEPEAVRAVQCHLGRDFRPEAPDK